MSDKFQNKYRIKSTRLPGWDYRWNSPYFVTICTEGRTHFFGEIKNGKMQLTDIGRIADKFWNEIPKHFPFVRLGEFVVMPNHTHGIILIENKNDGFPSPTKKNVDVNQTTDTPKLEINKGEKKPRGGKNEQWNSGNLGVIVNQYKRICTINARKTNPHFGWQARFHDRIIRDENGFNTISEYIRTNPENWKKDKFYL